MARTYDQSHLMAVPSLPARGIQAWCRSAANTINGLLSGQDARPKVWTDYLASINTARVAGSNVPSWTTLLNGVNAYSFSASSMNEVWVSFHINHDVAIGKGCKIYPHVHWTANSSDTGDCRWGIEYTYAKGHQQGASSVFPATTTVYALQAFSGTPYEHHIAEVSDDDAIDVQTAGIEVDGVILCRVFRDAADAADDFADPAFGLFVDLHIQIERNGTVQKAPDFYSTVT
jgi:hypothetical protein